MSKFANLYAIETKKMLKTKVLLVIGVIILIVLVIMATAFEIINSVEIGGGELDFESAEQGLDYYNQVLVEFDRAVDAGTVSNSFWSNTRGQIKSSISYFQYLVDNNLTMEQAEPYSSGLTFGQLTTGIGFVRTILQAVGQFAILAVIIISAANMVGEHKNGTLKMLLLRPVSRKSVFTAKWCASMTLGGIIYVGATIISMIYGLIRFKGMQSDVIMISGNSAFLINSAGVFALEFFSGLLSMFVYCQLTYFIGNLSKSRNITLTLSILVLFLGGLISNLLGYIYIGFIDLIYNLNFLGTMSVGASLYPGTTIYGSLAIVAVYIAIFMLVNYISFDKREIN